VETTTDVDRALNSQNQVDCKYSTNLQMWHLESYWRLCREEVDLVCGTGIKNGIQFQIEFHIIKLDVQVSIRNLWNFEIKRPAKYLEVIREYLKRKKADKAAKAPDGRHQLAELKRDGPFRFLDLPKELRLVVYERLLIKTTHRTYKSCVVYCPYEKLNGRSTYVFTTVTKSLPGVMILAACKLVFDEAERILRRRLNTHLNQPPKILVNACHAKELFWSLNSPIHALNEYQGALAETPNLTFEDYLPYLKHAIPLKKRLPRDGRTNPNRHFAILRNPGVRNYMHKAARQMAYFDPLQGHNPWKVRLIDIGITNLQGNPDIANDLRKVFREKCGSGAYVGTLMRI
jgi:hypothetical protein